MRRLATLLVMVVAAPMLQGQTVPGILSVPPQQCVWRAGDNPAWARPSLDEAGWHLWSAWNPASLQPRLWIRCDADLSSLQSTPRPALQIQLYAAYEIYVDGRLIGSVGTLQTGAFTMDTIREWPLSDNLPSPAVIAIRVTRRIVSTVPVGPLPPLAIHAGATALLRDRRSGVILAQVRPLLIPAVCFCIIGILGVVLIPLWLNDRSRPELLLLSICCVSLPAIYLNYLGAAALIPFPVAAYIFAWTIPAALVNFTRVLFFFALARRHVPLVFWMLIIAGTGLYLPTAIEPLLPPARAVWLNTLFSHQLEALGDIVRVLEEIAPFAAFLPWSRLTARMKPIAFLCMMWGTAMMAFFAVRSTGARIHGIPDLQLHWSNATADGEALTVLSVVIALFFLLFREQQQTARERAILAGEMQAGREVQRHLVPLTLPTISGFRCESAYFPAAEVGGDFYQVLPQPDSSRLVVIGDVSGKGLKAAMTGSVVLGALRSLAQETLSPAQILSRLNHQLAASSDGGFVTCLCARLAADGALTLANAGHLPPYRNGEEVPLDSGLPLGITTDTTYAEFSLTLTPGDLLTFLSDGVVEAQSPSGELFGFDRTRQISTRSAEQIVVAAQAFGQRDDITVLTLQYAPAGVLHA
jgi:hypothetical protein